MKKVTLPLLLLFILGVTQNFAQDIAIDGKKFQTVKKTPLTAETSFYQLKEKGKAGAKEEAYIKTGNEFSKTVFTELELKNFFQTGKIGSLGKTSIGKIGDSIKVKYLAKGGKKVFLTIKNDQLLVYEYKGDLGDLFMNGRLANGENPSPERKECGQGCLRLERECRAEFGSQDDVQYDICFEDFIACVNRCDEAFGRKGSGLINYTLIVNAVKISR